MTGLPGVSRPETSFFQASDMFTLSCSSIRADRLASAVVLALALMTCGEKTLAEPPPVPDVLKLLPRETPKPRYGVPVPKRISGRVARKSDGGSAGMANVSVTDGYSVVKTDRQGRFSIVPDPNAVFLYLTRPSGHDVVGDWYKPLSAEVDFVVQPAEADENEDGYISYAEFVPVMLRFLQTYKSKKEASSDWKTRTSASSAVGAGAASAPGASIMAASSPPGSAASAAGAAGGFDSAMRGDGVIV